MGAALGQWVPHLAEDRGDRKSPVLPEIGRPFTPNG